MANDNSKIIEILRDLSDYFNLKLIDVTRFNSKTISNGYYSRQKGSASKDYMQFIGTFFINDLQPDEKEFNEKNFLIWYYHMIKLLEDKNLIEDLYKDKNNINIYDFLSKVINANGRFNNDVTGLDEEKVKQLRIIQSKMICVFSSHNDYITNLVHNRVDMITASKLNHSNNLNLSDTDIEFNNLIKNHFNIFKNLINMINKKIRFESHKYICLFHIQNGSTPSSLFYDRFPRPFFQDSEEFVNNYNQLIKEFQKNTLNIIKNEIDDRLKVINDKINDISNELSNNEIISDQNIDIDKLIVFINNCESKQLNEFIIKAKNKAQRAIQKPFTCIKQNNINDNNSNDKIASDNEKNDTLFSINSSFNPSDKEVVLIEHNNKDKNNSQSQNVNNSYSNFNGNNNKQFNYNKHNYSNYVNNNHYNDNKFYGHRRSRSKSLNRRYNNRHNNRDNNRFNSRSRSTNRFRSYSRNRSRNYSSNKFHNRSTSRINYSHDNYNNSDNKYYSNKKRSDSRVSINENDNVTYNIYDKQQYYNSKRNNYINNNFNNNRQNSNYPNRNFQTKTRIFRR